jgi:hypothetical protein
MEDKKMRGKVFLAIAAVLFMLSPAEAGYDGGIGFTAGRLGSIVGLVVGLTSVVIGWLALRSANYNRPGKQKSILALTVGLIAIVLSGVHLARATGDFGTGSGRLGAIVALVVGLIGMVLGGLALARFSRKNYKT